MDAPDVQLLDQSGLAVLLGGLVGLERELLDKPAGLRTNILICLGATLFTHLSVELATAAGPPADPARIAAQVVSGIGFLGAGAIIQSRGNVTGRTTAATIWMVAAMARAPRVCTRGSHARVCRRSPSGSWTCRSSSRQRRSERPVSAPV